MSEQELREKIEEALRKPAGNGFFVGYTIYSPVVDRLEALIHSYAEERVIDELKLIRKKSNVHLVVNPTARTLTVRDAYLEERIAELEQESKSNIVNDYYSKAHDATVTEAGNGLLGEESKS